MFDLETNFGLQQWDATLASRTEIDKDDDNLKGSKDDYGMSFQEIAEIMGITRERVRQIEAKALGKLRHCARSKLLTDFVD
jgi:RNA polymerase primary sigma factor